MSTIAVLTGKYLIQKLAQFGQVYRLYEVAIESGLPAAFLILSLSIARELYDRDLLMRSSAVR